MRCGGCLVKLEDETTNELYFTEAPLQAARWQDLPVQGLSQPQAVRTRVCGRSLRRRSSPRSTGCPVHAPTA